MATVEETQVLVETVAWLEKEGWRTMSARAPTRRGARAAEEALTARGVRVPEHDISSGEGPDVIAQRAGMEWRIECKGLGERSNTRWSDFYRGLGEAVCHFDKKDGLRLGFAFPDSRDLRRFASKMSPGMRGAIGLWVLLVDVAEQSVAVVSPQEVFCPFCDGATVYPVGESGHIKAEHPDEWRFLAGA